MPSINASMENLPEELMVDILSRLPVKTIIHCKCVCNKWQNLVFSSYFINLHLSRPPTGLLVGYDAFILNNAGGLQWVEIEDKLDHHHLHHDPIMNFDLNRYLPAPVSRTMIPVGSVNGLICISQRQRGLNVDNVYICNPITREYLNLPRQQCYRDGKVFIGYRFGVNSRTGEYKVLRTLQSGDRPYPRVSSRPSLLEAEVCTLGTSQWRCLGQIPYEFIGYGPNSGSFLNSHFHWIVINQDASEKLCTFDLDTETFQLFPSSPTESIQGNGFHYQSLGVLKGCLCKIDTYSSQLTIWVMKEYGIKKSWHKEVVINQVIFRDLDWPIPERIILIKGLKDGSILMVRGNRLLAYCPHDKTIKDLEISGSLLIVLAHRPSFLKLQNFESERVHTY